MVAEANSSEPSALYLSGCGHPSTLAKPTMCIKHICGNITIHTCKTQNVHKTHLRQYHNTHMSGACLLDSQNAAVHLPNKLFEGDIKVDKLLLASVHLHKKIQKLKPDWKRLKKIEKDRFSIFSFFWELRGDCRRLFSSISRLHRYKGGTHGKKTVSNHLHSISAVVDTYLHLQNPKCA